MDAIAIAIVIVALIVWGLERNRRHQLQPTSRLAGSTDVIDRDGERIRCDLRARF